MQENKIDLKKVEKIISKNFILTPFIIIVGVVYNVYKKIYININIDRLLIEIDKNYRQ